MKRLPAHHQRWMAGRADFSRLPTRSERVRPELPTVHSIRRKFGRNSARQGTATDDVRKPDGLLLEARTAPWPTTCARRTNWRGHQRRSHRQAAGGHRQNQAPRAWFTRDINPNGERREPRHRLAAREVHRTSHSSFALLNPGLR
jgi:hypothetical protein